VKTAVEAWTVPTWQDFKNVWSVTWPFWLKTLGTFPLAALWFDIGSNLRPNVLRQLKQQERRQYKITQHQNKAAKRTRHPNQVPDAAAGSMIIGVPIRQEDE
jgi:lipopolysaccharide biosynthesis glycosyltransferase